MIGLPAQSTLRSYLRLLSYARPYGLRLAIGILAGFLSSGSLFGLLQLSPEMIRPFEARGEQVARAGPAAPADSGHVRRVDEMARRLGIPATDSEGRMSWQLMALGLVGLPILVIFKGAADYLNRYYTRWAATGIVRDVRSRLFNHLQTQSLAFFGHSDVGRLISRCTNDTATIESVVANTAAPITRCPLEVVAAISFIVVFALQNELGGLILMMLLVFPLCLIPVVLLGWRVKNHMQFALERFSGLVSRMHENFTGVKIVKAFHMERVERERFEAVNDEYFQTFARMLRAEALMSPFTLAMALVVMCLFFVVCYANGAKLYQILPVGIAAIAAYRPIKQLTQVNARLQRGAAALHRVEEALATDTKLPEPVSPVRVTSFEDRVVFERVSFRYEPDGPLVLRDISLEMPRGSVVALVGETGSGKTTFADILARFYDPTEGQVLLDGTDLRTILVSDLRQLVGVVTQETVLFNETIADNIAYGTPNCTREQIIEAARKANAHEFIEADRAGYDRVVGEKGFVLSGGQRQRLALARAILKNAPILILDEATSALDTATERLVQQAISRAMEGRTVLAIAHRLSTVRNADCICLLDDGRITEQGTHDELYAAGGHYRTLCDLQVLDG